MSKTQSIGLLKDPQIIEIIRITIKALEGHLPSLGKLADHLIFKN